MVETKSLLIKEVKKTELIAYFIDYLMKHTYIKAKNIAIDYLKAYRNYYRNNDEIRSLGLKFGKLIIATQKLGLVVKFSSSTFRVINPINYSKLEHKLIRMVKMKGIIIGA
jgi:hypothetical protein